jgi:hypothetical protein
MQKMEQLALNCSIAVFEERDPITSCGNTRTVGCIRDDTRHDSAFGPDGDSIAAGPVSSCIFANAAGAARATKACGIDHSVDSTADTEHIPENNPDIHPTSGISVAHYRQ